MNPSTPPSSTRRSSASATVCGPPTSTGTTVYSGATVGPEGIVPFETRFRYQTAFYQLVLDAVLPAAAAVRDISAQVARRERGFSHGSATTARHDPRVLQVVGRAGGATPAPLQVTTR